MRSRTTLIEAVSQSYWVATVVSLPTLYLRAIKTSLASVFGSGFSRSGGRVSDVIARVMLPLVRLPRSYRLSSILPAHASASFRMFNRFRRLRNQERLRQLGSQAASAASGGVFAPVMKATA